MMKVLFSRRSRPAGVKGIINQGIIRYFTA